MFNPHPYDDPTAVNKPELSDKTIHSIITGIKQSASYISNLLQKKLNGKSGAVVIALDGYIGAEWEQTVNLISQELKLQRLKITAIDFADVYKSSAELDKLFAEYLEENLEKDPVLLFGKLFKGDFEDIIDNRKYKLLKKRITEAIEGQEKEVIIVYGCGAAIKSLRSLYDFVFYFDVTPKEVILRAKKGKFANLGDTIARPVKTMLRRCYYVDFELAGHLRWDMIENDEIDYYVASNDPDNIQLIPKESFSDITSALVRYPLRCKPVYIEGVWGGHYMKSLRNLPDNMRNAAWVFDLIPLEVSIVVEAGSQLIEMPYFTFVQKEGTQLMGQDCVDKFGGYFPIRFNYDDSYHSSGNMSVQLHSSHQYNIENYGEHGRQDESYYVIATGHGAKTYLGFNEDVNPDEFIREAKKSEKEFTPIDYQKYINHVQSMPGTQVMIPAGTIHSSGRNQVVLEIGSLTVGSYTYKMYDYLRADLDGKPRPIHTYHGERELRKERKTNWVKENLVQTPWLVRSGEGWAEYIVGEHDLLYFSLRRFEFENEIRDNTNGKFHVLTLVDGEKVLIQSVDNPEHCYTSNYLDVVVVPANMGSYVVKNIGNQPVCIHKTMLKDGFTNEELFIH
ncbi:phosphoheptose isomerase [Maribellus comscasis]|uniref:Phosphoheptose isomerase n=2 Tax=Maribellus comscasis TaxID=2681766 RepID=A0A6I6K4B5_9BACT|nr:phosphoheptose isomerase [Maribellus comscasis]